MPVWRRNERLAGRAAQGGLFSIFVNVLDGVLVNEDIGIANARQFDAIAVVPFQDAAQYFAIGEDYGAQASTALKGLLRAGAECLIHPIARFAFPAAAEPNPLHLEFRIEPRSQIDARGDDITPKYGGRFIMDTERRAEGLIDLLLEEGDLEDSAFEVLR